MSEIQKFKTEELEQFIKDGLYFNFCVSHALNLGFEQTIRDRKDFTFDVGDYKATFKSDKMMFEISHREYIFRVIHAYYTEVIFTGTDESEVIEDLLTEFRKHNP